jgi:hypothetical protein
MLLAPAPVDPALPTVEQHTMASIGTMSAAPPKADRPITLAKPESPNVRASSE